MNQIRHKTGTYLGLVRPRERDVGWQKEKLLIEKNMRKWLSAWAWTDPYPYYVSFDSLDEKPIKPFVIYNVLYNYFGSNIM